MSQSATEQSEELLPWLVAPLTETLRKQHGHALLVHGPEGVGQFDFAVALSRAWLCETPAAQRPAGLACGYCDGCHLVHRDQVHPDLVVLLPEALHLTLGWRRKFDPTQIDDSKKKPSKWISIDQVRAAVEFSELTRSRGCMKVVLIHPAERMQHVAASALLKLLEEPPDNMRLALSCGDASALLPTVRSRCQAIFLTPPERKTAEAWLNAVGLTDAALLLTASGGQPLAAVERHAVGLDAALWSQLPAMVAAGNAIPLAKLPLPLAIESLQKLCHDALSIASGAAPRYFDTNLKLQADVHRLTDWGRELRRVAKHAEHPWNASLILESLVQQGQRAVTIRG